LINDLLDLARIEAGKVELILEPVACREVIEELDAVLRPAAEAKGLTFVLVAPNSNCMLRTDRRALTQILLNLTNNAIKFTGQGEVRIDFKQWRDAGGVEITNFTVADTGIGIAAEDQARLFESFQQLGAKATRRNEGAGLGLHPLAEAGQPAGRQHRVRQQIRRGKPVLLDTGRSLTPWNCASC
jgi:signal transduction histidine kinase